MKIRNVKPKRIAVVILFFVAVVVRADAQDFRNITVASFDYYFDTSYRLVLEDVFLARLASFFSLQMKIARYDGGTLYEHVFSAGPVINFSDNFYLDALYGLGINSQTEFSHRAELNLNYETATSGLTLGIKAVFFPSDGFYYFVPTAGGWVQPVDWLSLFSKFFFSWDSTGALSGSAWGELSWIVDKDFAIRTGFTLSYAELNEVVGYSILAGVTIKFSATVSLKYTFQFLANTTDYLFSSELKDDPPPSETKYGIQNGLILDVNSDFKTRSTELPDDGLPEVLPGLNLKKGLQQIGGSRENYLKVLLKFYRNRKNAMQDIKKCLAKNDIPAAQAIVHALKGVAGNIGAEELYAAVCDLESVIKENKKDAAGGKIEIAENRLAEVTASLSLLAAEGNTGNDENHPEGEGAVGAKKVSALINELETALDGYDAGSMNILGLLKAAVRNTHAIPEMDVIEKLLDKYDFDGARDVLQEVIARLNGADGKK